MKRLKIGFVLDDGLDRPDGVQQYVLTLGAWLRQQGHEVHYLVGETTRKDIPHVHSLARNVTVKFNQNRLRTPLPVERTKLKSLLESEKFDVLHVQTPHSPLFASAVVKYAGPQTAVVGTFHIAPNSRLEHYATRLLGMSLSASLKRFDKILSVSSAAQAFAKDTFKVRSTVVPNAVNMSSMSAGKALERYQDGKINIVFLGRLVERKGCQYLLSAVAQMHARQPATKLRVLICGKGPLEKSLKKFVSQHDLQGIVEFVGFIQESEKADYLATADIAVFPSTGGESFGIVLIEAIAAGAGVVVGGNNSGYRTVLTDPRMLVDPKDTTAFAKTLLELTARPDIRSQLHAKQRELVRSYDINVVGPAIVKQYHQAIANRQKKRNN